MTSGTHNPEDAPVDTTATHPPLDEIAFAHASERVAAEILDFYRIQWQYEPVTFPIEWDGKGNVIASFAPDFYLPEFDIYIELTTMSQKLVTKKNRKVRRLRELYPDVNVKIFYQKDFRRLLARFGVAVADVAHSDGGGVVAVDRHEAGERGR
jgi:hypoxanthine phosphoribosyltransferase